MTVWHEDDRGVQPRPALEARSLEALIRELTPKIDVQLLRYRGLSHSDRADVRQNALVQVLRHIADFRGASQLTTWLHRVTENEALGLMRSARRRNAHLEHDLDLDAFLEEREHGADVLLSNAGRDECVRQAIERLPESQRRLVKARYEDGLQLRQVADRFGMTELAVRGRCIRIRAHLQLLLARCDERTGLPCGRPFEIGQVSGVRRRSGSP